MNYLFNYPYLLLKLFPYKAYWNPKQSFSYQTFWPWAMTYKDKDSPYTYRYYIGLNHEQIHALQMLEWVPFGLIALFFFPWYVGLILFFGQPILNGINLLINYLVYGNWYEAYRNSLVEREAYGNQDDFNYLQNRIPFSWIKYIFRA